jgi:segregation and condensation protein A
MGEERDSDEEKERIRANLPSSKEPTQKVGQEQIQGLLFGEQLSWQAIIYDLINSEQLDPWDIDIVLLTNKYLEKVKVLEEANFFISSKVLLAASLLLRIKSEILLNQYIPSLDDILFGRTEEKKYVQERIELDEEIPDLIPRSPLPRARKVTLKELMAALGKAISTENRRIRKVITARQQEIETALSLPKRRFNLIDQVKTVYGRVMDIFSEREEGYPFSDFAGKSKEERIEAFVPLLHLDNNHKIVLEQEKHFDEIWIWLKEVHNKKNAALLELWRREVEEAEKIEEEIEEMEEEEEEEEKKPFKKKKVDENRAGLKQLFK